MRRWRITYDQALTYLATHMDIDPECEDMEDEHMVTECCGFTTVMEMFGVPYPTMVSDLRAKLRGG